MKRYAADILDGKEIAPQLSFPPDMEKLTMSMDQRRDFYLIFKEAVHNLVKYSKATEALIEVHAGRLSDYLFVLARYISHLLKVDEMAWKPRL